MSRTVRPAPVLRVCSCLTGKPERLAEVEKVLTGAFGEIALRSDPFPFEMSDYYSDEMGGHLERRWLCFGELFGAELLPQFRLTTGRIEERFSTHGKRRVNLDPGYLDLGKLVLASMKEAPDKIYMGEGVWAHTCLVYRAGLFSAPDHSFPDFQDGRFDDFMLRARDLLKKLLRQHSRSQEQLRQSPHR
jgi:hypothetical protein